MNKTRLLSPPPPHHHHQHHPPPPSFLIIMYSFYAVSTMFNINELHKCRPQGSLLSSDNTYRAESFVLSLEKKN